MQHGRGLHTFVVNACYIDYDRQLSIWIICLTALHFLFQTCPVCSKTMSSAMVDIHANLCASEKFGDWKLLEERDILETKECIILIRSFWPERIKSLHYTLLRETHKYTVQGLVPGGTVGWGTVLQARRSRVQFQMVSLDFFIDIILQAALCPWGWLSL